MGLIVRALTALLAALIFWPILRKLRKEWNLARARCLEMGIEPTFKNIFFLDSHAMEAKRQETNQLLAEAFGTVDDELRAARVARDERARIARAKAGETGKETT